jgi:glucose 1-dehydrogenase
MRLAGRVAVVTGASQGIGRALALGLAREGARVVVNHPPSAASPRETLEEMSAFGAEARAVEADVADAAGQDRIIAAAVDGFGRLDVLVNNAGVQVREAFLTTSLAAWDLTIGVNLKAPFFLSQKAARVMARSGGGKIINVSSVHDTVPLAERSAYSISKAGLAMLTKALALELAEHRITVNAVAPGAILTDMNRQALSDPESRRRLVDRIPLNRLGDVSDLVGAAVYLASDESSYVTGATLIVDGGLLLRRL